MTEINRSGLGNNKLNHNCRAWVLTVNNWDETDRELIEKLLSSAAYGIYAEEVAPETGMKHLQIYFYNKSAIKFTALCNKLKRKGKEFAKVKNQCISEFHLEDQGEEPENIKNHDFGDCQKSTEVIFNIDETSTGSASNPGEVDQKLRHYAWMKPAKGSAEANRTYIMGPYRGKDGKEKPYNELHKEFGTMPTGQGRDPRFLSLCDEISNGRKARSVIKEDPMMGHQYGRTFDRLESIYKQEQTVLKPVHTLDMFTIPPIDQGKFTRSIILYGPAGTGKTSYAKAHFPDGHLVVSHMDDLKHFDDELHTGIIFDDMSFSHLPRSTQIHLLDNEIPRSINVKHGTALIPCNTRKIFTTNLLPEEAFDLKDTKRVEDTALTRRIHSIHIVESIVKQ